MLSKSNLLVVSHQYNQFVKSQIDELAKHYNSITVLARYNRIASISHYLPIEYLKPYSAKVKINRDDKPENVRVIGVPIFYLPTTASRRRLGDRHSNKLIKIIERNDISFDLIHSHLSWTAGYAGQVISDQYDVPHIITVHENRDLLESELSAGNEDLYWAWKEADMLLRVNKHDIDSLKEYNSNTVYVPNGYDVNRFEPIPKETARQKLDIDADVELLFSLGRLVERKGFHNLISSLPIISRERENTVNCAIGGHGPKKKEYKKLASRLGVEDQLRLLGYIPNNELKYWMSAADVFVFPSYSESFGIVQLEAMACGTPVIAAINGGSEYVISSDEVGLLITDPEDHDEFANVVLNGLDRDWSSKKIVDYANKYTIPEVCKQIADLHNNLLNSNETNK